MANNIIISRIQNRRGRRENLPQPLLPAEVALTADSGEVWIGSDPGLATPTINVYEDKLEATAQGIVDNNIAESKFDENFSASNFNTMVLDLTGTPTPAVVLTDKDILWDNTFHGEILDISTITTPGSGYTTGDAITAVSATGSGFVGTVTATAGAIDGVVITSGGSNYRQSNTTFTIAAGTGGEINVVLSDIHGTSVHIAADPNIDALNTIANITTAVSNTSAPVSNRLISTAAFGGTFATNSLVVNNHTEAANVTILMNRVNSTTPNEITGIVFTNLNIKLNQGATGAVTLDTAQTITGLKTFNNDLIIDNGQSLEIQGTVSTELLTISVDSSNNAVKMLTSGMTTGGLRGWWFEQTVRFRSNTDLFFYDPTNVDNVRFTYGGTDFSIIASGTGTKDITIAGLTGNLLVRGFQVQQIRAETTATLEAIANDINTNSDKRAGYRVFNTTTSIPVWAVGPNDNSVWVDATGTTVHTPVV